MTPARLLAAAQRAGFRVAEFGSGYHISTEAGWIPLGSEPGMATVAGRLVGMVRERGNWVAWVGAMHAIMREDDEPYSMSWATDEQRIEAAMEVLGDG